MDRIPPATNNKSTQYLHVKRNQSPTLFFSSMGKLNLSSLTLRRPVSIFSDVTRRNPVAANQSPAFSYRRVLPADRLVLWAQRERERERGMPSTLADIITIIISPLIFLIITNWIAAVTLNSRSSSFTGFLLISSNLTSSFIPLTCRGTRRVFQIRNRITIFLYWIYL